VRPECARPWSEDRPDLVGPLHGTVAYVEALGRETFVGVDVAGAQLVVHYDGRAPLLPGDALAFGLLPSGLRFFDVGHGAAIARPGARVP
jgi:ABC-type sugar transport system ATPase subunit